MSTRRGFLAALGAIGLGALLPAQAVVAKRKAMYSKPQEEYLVFVHPDREQDLREHPGFIASMHYRDKALAGEIGRIGARRVINDSKRVLL